MAALAAIPTLPAPPLPAHTPLQVHRSRFKMTCQICQQPYGACVQCCDPRCYAGFHPLCARQEGYKMEVRAAFFCLGGSHAVLPAGTGNVQLVPAPAGLGS